MRILLVSPNTLTIPYPVYPLGLDYVAGSVSPEHEVQIADLHVVSLEELEKILLDFSPQIIGLSCRNIDNTEAGESRYFIDEYAALVSRMRSYSKAVIVCGGSGFTIMPEQILSALGADYGIIGEGERFGLLVEAIENGRNPAQIPGVISSSSPMEKWNPVPWNGPIVRDFRSHPGHNHFYLDKGGMLNLQSKRGCCFNCIYCPYPHIEGRKHRLVEPEEVARMALELQAAGAKYFFITDSAFNSDINHSLAVAKAFKAAGVSIPWGGFFAPVKLPPDYFSIMAGSGLAHVEFGTEALSDPVLKTYRKPFGVPDVFVAHQQALDAGLHVAHYFLMGGPGESADTITESLNNIDQLQKTVLFFFIGIRIYPRTSLYDIALREGKITSATNLLEPIFYESDNIDQRTIETLVTARVGKRINCVVGSGGLAGANTVSKMHGRGYSGPLWEYLIR
jgi:radical SAM superfamily enzyme YgiQ (UPF0313 family)